MQREVVILFISHDTQLVLLYTILYIYHNESLINLNKYKLTISNLATSLDMILMM